MLIACGYLKASWKWLCQYYKQNIKKKNLKIAHKILTFSALSSCQERIWFFPTLRKEFLEQFCSRMQGLCYAKHFFSRQLLLQLYKWCGGYTRLEVHSSRQHRGEVHVGALWGQPKPHTACGPRSLLKEAGLHFASERLVSGKTSSLGWRLICLHFACSGWGTQAPSTRNGLSLETWCASCLSLHWRLSLAGCVYEEQWTICTLVAGSKLLASLHSLLHSSLFTSFGPS